MFEIFLHHMELPVVDVETLDELSPDQNLALFTIDSSMTSQMLRSTQHFVRWDEFGRYLRQVELPSDPFLSTDAQGTDNETFTNTLRSAKIAETLKSQHEAIKYFHDLSDIIALVKDPKSAI